MSPKAPFKELVQVLFDEEEFQMISRAAAVSQVKVAHWVREAARQRLGFATVDAWDASSADSEDARLTRESSKHGSYLLRCITPPLGTHMAVEVQWVASGARGLTEPLFQKTLLDGDYFPFREFGKGRRAFLYLRGAGYWEVVTILRRVDGVGVVELRRVGFAYADVLETCSPRSSP